MQYAGAQMDTHKRIKKPMLSEILSDRMTDIQTDYNSDR